MTRVLPDETEEPLYSKNTNLEMPAGTLIRWEQASGGGYGDPLEREPDAVLRDFADEYITIDMARETYGVVIDPNTREVDRDETDRLRAERGAESTLPERVGIVEVGPRDGLAEP